MFLEDYCKQQRKHPLATGKVCVKTLKRKLRDTLADDEDTELNLQEREKRGEDMQAICPEEFRGFHKI